MEYCHDYPQILSLVHDRAVNDPNEFVRAAAIKALAVHFRNEPQTLPLLHDWITTSSHDDVRLAALDALAQFFSDDSQTLPLLRERAENDPTPWLRERAKELVEEISKNKQTSPANPLRWESCAEGF